MNPKTTKTLLFSIAVFSVAISIAIGTQYVTAEKQNDVPEELVAGPQPQGVPENFKELDDAELKSFERMVTQHPELSKLLGEEYEYTGTTYRLDPVVSYFEMNFLTEDGQVLNVAFEDGQIIDYKKYERPDKWAVENGIVDRHYTGSFDIRGVAHYFDAADFTPFSTSEWNAMITNGLKSGSDVENDNVCNDASAPDTYWAQAGVQYTSDGTEAAVTDTIYECVPQVLTGLTVNDGDAVEARVFLDDSTANKWWMLVDNLDDGSPAYGATRTVSGSTELEISTVWTSVWWENNHEPNAGWYTDFSSDPVSDAATFKWEGDSNWYLWSDDTEDTSICKPTPNPTGLTSGSFATSPNDVTWDVSDIDEKCGRGLH